jgi:hypothetical protein
VTAQQEPFGLALTFQYDGDGNRTQVQDSFGGVMTSVYGLPGRIRGCLLSARA